MKNKKIPLWLSILFLLILVIPSHWIGPAKFSDIDEPWWIVSGSNFYYAVTHGDFENTVYEYHPGVTTTWILSAGMLMVFPEYRGFGQGYFDPRKLIFDDFLLEHGHRTVELVQASRLIQSALLIALAVVLFYLLQLLLDRTVSLAAVALAFDAPFFLGHSRLLNHEGLLSLFVLISLVSFFIHIHNGRQFRYLALSGAFFGLAQLTKSPSIVLVGVIGIMLLVSLFEREKTLTVKLLDAIKITSIWFGVAVLVYVALWPGMWVAPGKMLHEVYGNAFSYAFQGARLDVASAQQAPASSFDLAASLSGMWAYLDRLILRSTPFSWLGWLLMIPALFSRRVKSRDKKLGGYILLVALFFIIIFGMAKGRDSAHYILTSFFGLDLIAGLGWGFALTWLAGRWSGFGQKIGVACALAAVLMAQIASGLSFYPYYFTYANPLLLPSPADYVANYGEGLDRAAEYLAQKQDSEGLRVFVYNGLGTFSYFFPGKVELMKRAHFWTDGLPDIGRGMRWSEYVVIYAVSQDKLPECAAFLEALQVVQPEHVIYMYGVEYARVYRTADIPESVYAALKKMDAVH